MFAQDFKVPIRALTKKEIINYLNHDPAVLLDLIDDDHMVQDILPANIDLTEIDEQTALNSLFKSVNHQDFNQYAITVSLSDGNETQVNLGSDLATWNYLSHYYSQRGQRQILGK